MNHPRRGLVKIEDTVLVTAGGTREPIDAVRIITNEEMEAVWDDKKPAKAALDNSVSRGNAVLGAKPLLKKSQPF